MTDRPVVDVLCEFKTQFRLLAMVSALSLIVLLVSLLFVQPGTGTYVIAVIQIVTFAFIFVVSGVLIYVCARHTRNSSEEV